MDTTKRWLVSFLCQRNDGKYSWLSNKNVILIISGIPLGEDFERKTFSPAGIAKKGHGKRTELTSEQKKPKWSSKINTKKIEGTQIKNLLNFLLLYYSFIQNQSQCTRKLWSATKIVVSQVSVTNSFSGKENKWFFWQKTSTQWAWTLSWRKRMNLDDCCKLQ